MTSLGSLRRPQVRQLNLRGGTASRRREGRENGKDKGKRREGKGKTKVGKVGENKTRLKNKFLVTVLRVMCILLFTSNECDDEMLIRIVVVFFWGGGLLHHFGL